MQNARLNDTSEPVATVCMDFCKVVHCRVHMYGNTGTAVGVPRVCSTQGRHTLVTPYWLLCRYVCTHVWVICRKEFRPWVKLAAVLIVCLFWCHLTVHWWIGGCPLHPLLTSPQLPNFMQFFGNYGKIVYWHLLLEGWRSLLRGILNPSLQ